MAGVGELESLDNGLAHIFYGDKGGFATGVIFFNMAGDLFAGVWPVNDVFDFGADNFLG